MYSLDDCSSPSIRTTQRRRTTIQAALSTLCCAVEIDPIWRGGLRSESIRFEGAPTHLRGPQQAPPEHQEAEAERRQAGGGGGAS
eukprot:8432890-Pyramimonas_sp.AAC.1